MNSPIKTTQNQELLIAALRQSLFKAEQELTEVKQVFEHKLNHTEHKLNHTEHKLNHTEHKLESAEQKIAYLTHHNAHLIELFKQAQQARFGRKSEAFCGEQNDLFNEDLDADLAVLQAQVSPLPKASKLTPKNRPQRKPLPDFLEREERTLDLETKTCPECQHELRFLRNDISETLAVIPAKFYVKRMIRPQYSCPCCQSVHSQEKPAQLIERSQVDSSVLTQVVISKCLDHLPLHRQGQIFERSGVTLPTSTLSRWMGEVGFALSPLVDHLQGCLLNEPVIHCDETPVKILNSAHKAINNPGTQTVNGYMWVYASPHSSPVKMVMYDCQKGRSGQYARDFLERKKALQKRILVLDDYSGYKALLAKGNYQEMACMAHVRRKFHELYRSYQDPVAQEALEWFRQLYGLEKRIRKRPPDKIKQWRKRYAKPLMEDFQAWLLEKQRRVPVNSGIHKAIVHALKRWSSLLTYLEDGRVPIDNNQVERCIRAVALGRKNWLFAGSLLAGQRMAGIMSLLQTAKLNGLDPYAWLNDVLIKLPTWPNSRLHELMPFAGYVSTQTSY